MSRPAASEPYARQPSGNKVPQARIASQAAPVELGPAAVGRTNSSPRFYDGPTVSAKADEVMEKAKTVAKVTTAEAKRQSRNAVRTARRHPWGFASLFTAVPFIIFLSLFSTVICPPPDGSQSTVSHYVLSPLGLQPDPNSALLQTFCYPSNVYHREILQPYVYPVLEQGQTRLLSNPVYKNVVEPGYGVARETSRKMWEEPHLPYLRARLNTFTAPYTSRISAFQRSYVSPRLATAQSYAKTASDRSVRTFNYVSTHPVTDTTRKYTNAGFQSSRRRAYDAYIWSRPYLVRAGQQTERIAKEVVGPRTVRAIELGGDQAIRGWAVLKSQAARLYYARIDPYLGPQLSRASISLSPYTSTFAAKVYNPYLRPALEAFLPAIAFVPDPPKTFWSMIADKLPSVGSNVAQNKASMGDFIAELNKSNRPADVPIPGIRKNADRVEVDRVREAIRERVDRQGKKGYEKVQAELVRLYMDIISSYKQFPLLASTAKAEFDRDVEYILTGLDKLYTGSTSLTRDQVKQSSEMADDRVMKKVAKIRERIELQRTEWTDVGKPVVAEASKDVDAALGQEWKDLQVEMVRNKAVPQGAMQKFQAVRQAADEWKSKYTSLQKGETKDRQLTAASVNVPRAINGLKQELDDLSEGFRARVGILRRTAYDRIDARDAVSGTTRSSSRSSSSTVDSGRATILPIEQVGAVAGAAGAVIGKGKDQVMDALSQARSAAMGETPTPGVVDQARSVAASAYDAASSGVHDATRSAMAAVGATPSPESPKEHAESLLNVASGQAGSAYNAASSAVDEATRSVKRAVGASPSPESLGGHAESLVGVASESVSSLRSVAAEAIQQATFSVKSVAGATPSSDSLGGGAGSAVSAASQSASSLAAAVSEAVHHGTRSAMSALGATPSPKSAQEYLESMANVVAGGYASVAGVVNGNVHDAARRASRAVGVSPTPESAGDYVESIASAASASASSVAAAASSVVHDATKSAITAMGATPSPESLGEHAESIASVASASASSIASAASSVANDATRSAMKAVGVSPTPESAGEYAESIASVASASASSIASVASSALRDGTRSAMRAVGASATPSPETPLEHVESAYDAASSSAASAYGAASSVVEVAGAAVTDQGVLLASQIQSALGLVPTPTPLASTATAYLASLASAGSSAGSDLLASGSSLLASLQSKAGTTLHSATRAASRAVGATPSLETLGEYVESVQGRLQDATSSMESLVSEYATAVVSGAAEATQSVKSMVGRDEL